MGGISEATVLLQAGRTGDAGAAQRLGAVVYAELRGLAQALLRRERDDHTLQPTALVHEAYLRLFDQTAVEWEDETYFYGVAATTMRRVLVDHARRHKRQKRGGERQRVPLDVDALVLGVESDHWELLFFGVRSELLLVVEITILDIFSSSPQPPIFASVLTTPGRIGVRAFEWGVKGKAL